MILDFVKIIFDESRELPGEKDIYDKALIDIEKEKIAPQIYSLLKQQGRLTHTPVFFQQRLKTLYEQGLYQNLIIKYQMDRILAGLEEQGIDVIPLKGVFLAEKYFGHVGARPTGDIDILIRGKDIEKTVEIVKSLGFVMEVEVIQDHFHCSFGKNLPFSKIPLTVEIHWNIVKENTSKFNIEDLWNEAISIGTYAHVKELSPLHTFYMICLHGWRHNLDSTKYFIDIMQVLYNENSSIDYEKLFKLSDAHLTKKRLIRTLSIVYQQFPDLMEVKKLPFKRKLPFWAYKQPKGINLYIDFFDYQFLSYDSIKHCLTEFYQWVFPHKVKLPKQYDGLSIDLKTKKY